MASNKIIMRSDTGNQPLKIHFPICGKFKGHLKQGEVFTGNSGV